MVLRVWLRVGLKEIINLLFHKADVSKITKEGVASAYMDISVLRDNWILIAFLAPMFWALVNIIDVFGDEKKFKISALPFAFLGGFFLMCFYYLF